MAQEFDNRAHRELVLIGQRCDHTCLVHGAGGLRRGIGLQKARLHGGAFHGFDNDRNLGYPVSLKACQTLEAVEDLVGTIWGGRHAKGHSAQLVGVGTFTAQGPKGRPELADRNLEGHAHGRPCGRSTSWKRGYR